MTDFSSENPQKPINEQVVKLLACAIIILCLIVGLAGLILPIIPGLLFLALAGIAAAHYFPSVDRLMRRNSSLAAYLDSFGHFSHLSWRGKLGLIALLCFRILVDSLAFVIKLFMRLLDRVRQ